MLSQTHFGNTRQFTWHFNSSMLNEPAMPKWQPKKCLRKVPAAGENRAGDTQVSFSLRFVSRFIATNRVAQPLLFCGQNRERTAIFAAPHVSTQGVNRNGTG